MKSDVKSDVRCSDIRKAFYNDGEPFRWASLPEEQRIDAQPDDGKG